MDNTGEVMPDLLESAGRDHVETLILSYLHTDHCSGVQYLFFGFYRIARKPVISGFFGTRHLRLS